MDQFLGSRSDVLNVGRSGANAYDMGVYEVQDPLFGIDADLNGDGIVNMLDLFIFESQWYQVSGDR